MAVVDLLAEAREAGLSFEVRDGAVLVQGKADSCLTRRLREHKAEILQRLEAEEAAAFEGCASVPAGESGLPCSPGASDDRGAILAAMSRVVAHGDLPRLLWRIGQLQPEVLHEIEGLGIALADSMVESAETSDGSLTLLVEALEGAQKEVEAAGGLSGPRPIWAFWTLFTRSGEDESALSALLREEVGYPTDEEAGMEPWDGCDLGQVSAEGEGGGDVR